MSAPRTKTIRTKEPVPPQTTEAPAPPVYRVGRKPLKVGTKMLQPGEVVPDAHTWPRVEAWVRSGWLRRD